MRGAYYNENDAFAAGWLRSLAAAGHLAAGRIDDRSVLDVDPSDLFGYRECHFFAGIGGWPCALRLAGWPEDREVWTGSCPCQPLSSAGQRKGHADERHIWPAFYALIAERRPATIFGEQVASKDGREWLSGVRADLEALGYAVGAADLCAASVGAPHIRQRLFWVADADPLQPTEFARDRARPDQATGTGPLSEPTGCGQAGGLGNPNGSRREALRDIAIGRRARSAQSTDTGSHGRLGDTPSEQMGRTGQPWSHGVWLPCLDGKARRIEPTIQPLAHGIPNRVGLLRGTGNAIVPALAAQFIRAFLEVE